MAARRVVFVDGVRIPFQMTQTAYKDMIAYDLGRMALKGLLNKTALDPKSIDYLTFGTVIQEVRTSNIARECALGAGIPNYVPSHTVTQACISANQAICTGAEKILAGRAEIVVAGGCETFSDVPIRHSRKMRQRLLRLSKVVKKGPGAIASTFFKGLSPAEFAPETPAIANFATGEAMGNSSDRLAAKFAVSREDQDEYALCSHQKAAKAHADGVYEGEIVPVDAVSLENGIKGDSKLADYTRLKPAFVKPHGTHTAANSSFLTDGAAATLIMSEAKALELGYAPKAFIKEWTFQAVDPFEELLLGPAYSCAKVLKDAGLTMADIDVFEIHEAFAGQVLANINAMASDKFGQDSLGRSNALGEVPMDKLNLWGGSLALGHPFGATGARLVTTAANRLHAEGGKYALLTACADSGLAHACILERYE
jgi:acetyl-CoA acyltransferase